MFNRSAFLAVVVAIVATVEGGAQGASIVPGMILRQPGEGNGVHLVAPTGLTTEPTFTFPSFSGTLLVTSSSSSPSFGGLTVSGGPITLDPGVGNNVTFANIPADPLTTVFLTLDGSGRLRTNTVSLGSPWLTGGTSITTPGTGVGQQYLGTSNAQDLVVAANATERLRITSAGTVTLPNVSVPQGSRFSISGTYTSALTADATQVNVNTTLNGAAAAFAARGASFTTILTNNVNGLTLAGVYARTTLQNSSGTIADASGVYADFSRTSGGGSATITRYTGLRSRHITNNASISGIGLFIDGPNNTGVLPAGASFSGIVIDTIPASGSATRRVFFYNAAPSEQVVITAGGALALGTSTPASSSKLEVAGTAGTPNVRLSALGGTAKSPAPVGYDRIVLANTNGDLDQVAASAVASVIGAQPLDGDLTALAGLTTTGIVVRDNTNSMVTRTLNASAPISITNANGVSGDPTISLGTVPVANGGTGATTLTANGVLIGNGTSPVTALATANNAMLVTDGTGVPSISTTFPSAVNVPFSQISGTIVASQFVGTGSSTNAVDLATAEVAGTLPVANGGTGATSLTANRLLLGNGTSAISTLATANNAMLVTDGTGVPSFSTSFPSGVNVPASQVTGTLPVANGGTGLATAPVNSIIYASAANTYSSLTPGNNQVLTSNGAGVPTWVNGGVVPAGLTANAPVRTDVSGNLTTGNTNLASEVTGTLPVANGGTGATSLTANRLLLGNGTSAISTLATANNAMLVTDGTGVPSFSTTFPSGVNVPASQITGTIVASQFVGTGSASTAVDLATAEVAGTLPVANGGTGATTLTANGVLIGNGTSPVTALATANNAMLVTNGTGVPSISTTFPSAVNVPFSQITGTIVASQFVGTGSSTNAVDLATAEVAGTLPVANGGTGATSLTANRLLLGNGTSAISTLATANNAMLVTDGTGAPSISTTFPSGVNVPASQITGTLPIANGGTNITTYTTGDILYASAANTLSKLAIGTSGQVLRVSAGGVPEWSSSTATSFGAITTGTNSTAAMTVNNGASIVLGTSGAIIEANRFKAGGSTDAVDLATAEVAGTLPIANGGTGATDAATARTNLGAQAADGDLTAVAALTTTGFVVRDNTNSMVTRTLGATSPISVTNADGVAGNPNISLGTVPVGNGGTGVTTLTANGVLLGNGTSAVSATAVGATGQVLIGNTAAAPTWSSTPSVSSLSLTNTSNQLVLGTTTTTTITSPAPSASRTYTIPDAGANADFVMTQGAQTVNGSKTFVDNVVVGSGATAAQIRFREPSGDGTNFSSFQAQAQSGDINYTLPATLPSVGQVLQATAVAGTNVTTAWVTPSSSVAVTTGRATANVGTTDETNYTTATDMNLTLQANTTYVIHGVLRFDNTNDNHETDVRFSFPTGATASIALARTSYLNTLSEFDLASPIEFIAVATDDDPYIYAVTGMITVGSTAGSLQIAIKRNANGSGADQSRLMSGSWWSITR